MSLGDVTDKIPATTAILVCDAENIPSSRDKGRYLQINWVIELRIICLKILLGRGNIVLLELMFFRIRLFWIGSRGCWMVMGSS